MRLTEVKIGNYKSYCLPTVLTFSSGFNVIAGQNNTGKTALLEALGLNFSHHPHRALSTSLDGSKPSRVGFKVALSGAEVKELLAQKGEYLIPLPDANSDFAKSIGFTGTADDTEAAMKPVYDWLVSQRELTFDLSVLVTKSTKRFEVNSTPSFGCYTSSRAPAGHLFMQCRVEDDGQTTFGTVLAEANKDFGQHVAAFLASRIYRFQAERRTTGTAKITGERILRPDGQNLAEVLDALRENPHRFKRLMDRLCSVLPQIKGVSLTPNASDASMKTVLVWNHPLETERTDLAIPLDHCGTGVGQVLAILYVVLSSKPQVITIDEPHSFLHPSAVRKLMNVLAEHSEHQYIIATHSPLVIRSADPPTIALISNRNGHSEVDSIDLRQTDAARAYLSELGATLSDVFGADDVLWVEGRTEEICFPRIIRKLGQTHLLGTAINSLVNTGDLDRKNATQIFEIYRKLSGANALLPPAIGFVLDLEQRDQHDIEDLKRRSGGTVRFLRRRMFENYLLNPEAIAAILNARDLENVVTVAQVQSKLDLLMNDDGLFSGADPPTTSIDKVERVHGARLLDRLFNELTETRVAYKKTDHSVALCDWLLENDREQLSELARFLDECFDSLRL